MRNRLFSLGRTCIIAGAIVLSAASYAGLWDTQITVDRAANSPTLTIKYSGTFAQLVELRVNGESVATRPLDAGKNSGETNFTLTLGDLREGDNDVEIRLFDKTGKLLTTQKSKITTESSEKGPVYVMGAKQGSTVSGPVEIKVGFGKEFKSTFVSFFIDSNFKSMSNYAPFSYVWDTAREANGWHEIEAWVVDESTTTYKSKKVRVFVNNAGGRTDRTGLGSGEYSPSKSGSSTSATGESGLKPNSISGSQSVTTTTGVKMPGNHPRVSSKVLSVKQVGKVELKPISGRGSVKVNVNSGTKPVPTSPAVSMGSQHMTPTGNRLVVSTAKVPTVKVPSTSPAGSSLIAIEKGQRLTGITTFAVLLNNSFVDFDVAPRVDGGVPMTPFRHLIEKAGGDVTWSSDSKTVNAKTDASSIWLKIGDTNAKLNDMVVSLEMAPYIDHGRTIVPLSFFRDALKVNIDFDKSTGHLLITSKK